MPGIAFHAVLFPIIMANMKKKREPDPPASKEIIAFCPGCGQKYRRDAKFAGANVECEKCGTGWKFRMMNIHCPGCGESAVVSAEYGGAEATCRGCGTIWRIPTSAPAASVRCR